MVLKTRFNILECLFGSNLRQFDFQKKTKFGSSSDLKDFFGFCGSFLEILMFENFLFKLNFILKYG